MTENVTYCDKHVSSRKCIFFVVTLLAGESVVASLPASVSLSLPLRPDSWGPLSASQAAPEVV
jgi:hypothetical protein